MKNREHAIRVIAQNNYKVHGMFDIFLEISGQKHFVMSHRHNGILFGMLKNGMTLGKLRSLKGREKGQVKYLLTVVDEFISEEMPA